MKFLEEMIKEYDANALTVKVTKEIKNKKGETIPAGEMVTCEFRDTRVKVSSDKYNIAIPYQVASRYLTKFKPEPSMRALERMTDDSIVTTPLGNRVEPDGYGPYGDPSWLLVLGLI